MADTYLIKLTYKDVPKTKRPASVVAKFPPANQGSLETGKKTDAYRLEINFYKYLAPKLNMRVPKCYFAEIDTDGSPVRPPARGSQSGRNAGREVRQSRQGQGVDASTGQASFSDLE